MSRQYHRRNVEDLCALHAYLHAKMSCKVQVKSLAKMNPQSRVLFPVAVPQTWVTKPTEEGVMPRTVPITHLVCCTWGAEVAD